MAASTSRTRKRAILLTSYLSDGTDNIQVLDVADDSYTIATKRFQPILQRWGEVFPFRDEFPELEEKAKDLKQAGYEPIHVSIRAIQDAYIATSIPNVFLPVWEFPDVPNQQFDGNPQNDWPTTASRCDMVVVGGRFTADALKKTDIQSPIRVVPVPIPNGYFELPFWRMYERTKLNCTAYVFENNEREFESTWQPTSTRSAAKKQRGSLQHRMMRATQFVFRSTLQRFLSRRLLKSISVARSAGIRAWREFPHAFSARDSVELSGVVFTSILNPADDRKNWKDLLSGFLLSLQHRKDATLVVRLTSEDQDSIDQVLQYYKRCDIEHICRVVFLTGLLDDQQLLDLAKASTFYLQTTQAEGNCIPLMNYLASGTPGVSPCHSAIGDFFDEKIGIVVQSHPEPACWPNDPQQRLSSTCHRLVWPSLCEQIQKAYQMAKHRQDEYYAMADIARERLRSWGSVPVVGERLNEALCEVAEAAAAKTKVSHSQRVFRSAAA